MIGDKLYAFRYQPTVGEKSDATPKQGRSAIERGLSFLQTDAVQWRKERECATCHHGTMTVWPLSEAKMQLLSGMSPNQHRRPLCENSK
jgi:hypothetical protein